MTLNVPDTRRLAPEADPATAPQVHASDATLYERLGGCYGIAGAVDVLVDRLFKNVKVNANDKVHEHHGNPRTPPVTNFSSPPGLSRPSVARSATSATT